MSNFFQGAIQNAKEKASSIKDKIMDKLGGSNNPWPQAEKADPELGAKGFLPPQLITPTLKLVTPKVDKKDNEDEETSDSATVIKKQVGQYKYEDWLGHRITQDGLIPKSTKEKFNMSSTLQSTDLKTSPYSTRDYYLLHNDSATDYFKHSLQVIDNLNNDFMPSKTGRLQVGQSTPYENNDPVMFGFEIIIDAVSSPLLNGAVLDFLDDYGRKISEVNARIQVYEDFKLQFVKLFKTKGSVKIDGQVAKMTNVKENYATSESQSGIPLPGKRAYMSYYLKKITGLENLAEKNSPSAYKYLADYGKDVIKIDFTEAVSLTLGTLAHLYKLLYWSKPNGKTIIPENLLRFNCDIIVSECRNFNRVKNAIGDNNLEIVKDNLSRYIYSLRECQFYFETMPHPGDIDMSAPVTYESYSGLSFDYKYSAVKFEKWTPGEGGFGKYVGYHGGAIWKIGNPGEKENRGTSQSTTLKDTSVPNFFTSGKKGIGLQGYSQNGVSEKLILNNIWPSVTEPNTSTASTVEGKTEEQEKKLKYKVKDKLKSFEKASEKKGKELAKKLGNKLVQSATRELQTVINQKTALLNKTLNKIFNSLGANGIRPPNNVYTETPLNTADRIFYDVRGELFNFAGDTLGGALGNGSGLSRRF